MRKSNVLLVLFSAAAALAADLPSAEKVLDRYVEVTGGKAAYEKRKGDIQTGTVEFVGMGVKGAVVTYQAAPNKMYSVIDLAGIGKMESGVVDGVAWEKSAMQGPRVKSGEERNQAIRMATYNAVVQWRDLYSKVETAGQEEVEGKKCVKIVAHPKTGGAAETSWYDIETGLMVKSESTMSSPMGEVKLENFSSDYKEVNGLKLPHSVITKVAGQTMKVTLEKVENTEIPAEKFAYPAEIKALLDKAKAAPTAAK